MIAAVVYSALITLFMIFIAPRFIAVSEATSQAEAEFRFALTRLRENGESIALLGGELEEQRGLRRALSTVIDRWRRYSHQHMRSTVVTNGNYLLAPTIPLILCAPKYLAGTMTLGEVTQAAAAFVQVQSAFNWLVDNYPRFSDWMASVRRVASLLISIDHLEAVGKPGEAGAIRRTERDNPALRLQDLSVTLDDGTVVIKEADVAVEQGEKVLVVGKSGTGKSTLVRAIAGLWPWGQGEISIRRGAKLFLMPQRPYIPLGSLRRVATYPLASSEVADSRLCELMTLVGVDYLVKRLDVEAPWAHMLSEGEKQRIAFVRLLLHRPDIVVMDEATSALDPAESGTADEPGCRTPSERRHRQHRPSAGAGGFSPSQARVRTSAWRLASGQGRSPPGSIKWIVSATSDLASPSRDGRAASGSRLSGKPQPNLTPRTIIRAASIHRAASAAMFSCPFRCACGTISLL